MKLALFSLMYESKTCHELLHMVRWAVLLCLKKQSCLVSSCAISTVLLIAVKEGKNLETTQHGRKLGKYEYHSSYPFEQQEGQCYNI